MHRTKDSEFWDAAGIAFSVAGAKDRKDIKKFLAENFFPDEPIFRFQCYKLFAAESKNILILI
jgi:hypothetical protein